MSHYIPTLSLVTCGCHNIKGPIIPGARQSRQPKPAAVRPLGSKAAQWTMGLGRSEGSGAGAGCSVQWLGVGGWCLVVGEYLGVDADFLGARGFS